MRWVVSILCVLLVLPLASALDISFDSPIDSYYKTNPVDISFTTDGAANCTYSLIKYQNMPDFSCESSSCTFQSCFYNCINKKDIMAMQENILLSPLQKNHDFSLDLVYGYYDLELSCTSGLESTSQVSSFLYDTQPLHVEWSMLTRERFATNQDSTFYAYLYGSQKVDSTLVTLTFPDKTTSKKSLSSFTPDNGYVFSYELADLSVAGKYSLEVNFTYGDDELTIKKDFLVVEAQTFEVDFSSDVNFNIEFIDPISDIVSFVETDVSSKKIVVPASRLHLNIFADDVFSLKFQNVDMRNYNLFAYYNSDYELRTDLIGENKPLRELASYIFHTNVSPEYISKVEFDYSSLGVKNPQKLQIFKAKASSLDNVNLESGEFYKVGSQRNPLYVDEDKKTAHIFVNSFSLFSLVEEQQIGAVISRGPMNSTIELSLENKTIEGISRDKWTFMFKGKPYSFLINAIDGAIVHFEFSPKGKIRSENVGGKFLYDLDEDETDDILIYVNAITPSKIIFYISLLTQPENAGSLDEIINEKPPSLLDKVLSTPVLFYSIVGLIVLVFCFGIIWLFVRGHKKENRLSQFEIDHLEGTNKSNQPILAFIDKMKKEGLEDKYIRTKLIVGGWPKDVVDTVLGYNDKNAADKKVEEIEKKLNQNVKVPVVETIKAQVKAQPIKKEKSMVNEDLVDDINNIKKEEVVVEDIPLEQQITASLPQKNLSHEEKSVLKYIYEQLAKNASKSQIRSKLEHIGWHKEFLDTVFRKVE